MHFFILDTLFNVFLINMTESYLAGSVDGSVIGLLCGLSFLLWGLLCVTLFALPMIFAAVRFHRNILHQEGYLSMTLPVTPMQHLFCKIQVPVIWSIVTYSLNIGCIWLILSASIDVSDIFSSSIGEMLSSTIFSPSLGVLYLVSFIISIYAGISVLFAAQLMGAKISPKKPVLGAVVVYFLFNIVSSTVSSIISGIATFDKLNENPYYASTEFFSVMLQDSVIIGIVLSFILLVGSLFLSNYFLTKHLNLA